MKLKNTKSHVTTQTHNLLTKNKKNIKNYIFITKEEKPTYQ